MRYRRALFVGELGRDPAPQLASLRRLAPRLDHLHVVTLDDVLDGEALARTCSSEQVDLVVFAARSLRSAWVASAERERLHVAVLWLDDTSPSAPLREIACVASDEPARAEIAAFLRDHADASMHVTLLSPTALAPDLVAAGVQLSGIEATVEVSALEDAPSVQGWIDEWTHQRRIDLLVFSRISTALLASVLRSAPVLLLPPPAARSFGQREIDVPDLLDDGGPIRARVDLAAAVGNPSPVPDQPIAFVAGGKIVATSTTHEGEVELAPGLGARSLGVYRAVPHAPAEPLAAVEERIAVISPGEHAVVVVDAELSDETLRALSGATHRTRTEILAVRLRPVRSFRALRARLRAAGLAPRVLDARLVLDEGSALDVSETLDPVRLARVASKLGDVGFPVAAIVHRGESHPAARGFDVLSDADVSSGLLLVANRRRAGRASPIPGNRVELELDNATARAWLLETIARSNETLHFQVYMALDDDVGRPVEAALAAAAARGVRVRVLVDSLHALHGSFGTKNPLLDRLAAREGVELRALRPITELPSLADLKQRDHRKLVVADGKVALLGGRNLSHEYYTPFEEIRITPASQWREVPWLDAGARVEGPVVASLEAAFLEAWTDAGGAPFAIPTSPAVGTTPARAVVHRGLRDAHTLEAYLELVDTAKSHVYAVNGFPLVLELQRALLRAIGRGVRVRALFGSMTPLHDGQPFGGPWAGARTTAMELVHSRMDPIVAAGGEAYIFAVRDVPGWAPELGVVHPHLHAKVMSADGLRCAVGSANMDITASYWESELLLVVEDAAVAHALESRLDVLMAGSTLVSRSDPGWQRRAARRAWMRHWPGVLSA